MHYPFAIKGQKFFLVPDDYPQFGDRLLALAVNDFRRAGMKQIKISSSRIDFRGSLFRWAWNGFSFLNPVTAGHIEMVSNDTQFMVKFRLAFHELLGICLGFSLIPLFFFILPAYHWPKYGFDHLEMGILAFSLIWFVIYTLSQVIAFIRFGWFLDRVVDQVMLEHAEREGRSQKQMEERVREFLKSIAAGEPLRKRTLKGTVADAWHWVLRKTYGTPDNE